MALTRELYAHSDIPAHNDFLGLIGNFEPVYVSSIPEKTLNYATIFKPFDNYIWAFIAASVLSVMLTFIVIDKTSTAWIEKSTNSSTHQSIKNIVHNLAFSFNRLNG